MRNRLNTLRDVKRWVEPWLLQTNTWMLVDTETGGSKFGSDKKMALTPGVESKGMNQTFRDTWNMFLSQAFCSRRASVSGRVRRENWNERGGEGGRGGGESFSFPFSSRNISIGKVCFIVFLSPNRISVAFSLDAGKDYFCWHGLPKSWLKPKNVKPFYSFKFQQILAFTELNRERNIKVILIFNFFFREESSLFVDMPNSRVVVLREK